LLLPPPPLPPLQARWHPLIIKWCIQVLYKAGKAGYKAIQAGGFLQLPSARTLKRHIHCVRQTEDVNLPHLKQVKGELEGKTGVYFKDAERKEPTERTAPEREVVVVFDGLHIQAGLLWDQGTGELVGFADTEDHFFVDGSLNLADQMVVFFIRGVYGKGWSVPISFASYARGSAQRLQRMLYAVLLAVSHLGLTTVGVICDGADENRQLIKSMLALPSTDDPRTVQEGLCFRNVAAPYNDVYFMIDYVHCMKNWRNALYESGRGSGSSRLLYREGEHLLWEHIREVQQSDLTGSRLEGISEWRVPAEAVDLNSWRKMRVHLACKVLSKRMSLALRQLPGDGRQQTSVFCEKWNDLFDLCNRPLPCNNEHAEANLVRMQQLCDYFTVEWLDYVDNQQTLAKEPKQKQRMHPAYVTMWCLRVSVLGMIGLMRAFCSRHGLGKGVIPRRLNQDLVENFFSQVRQGGGGSSTPSALQFRFGYQVFVVAHECMDAVAKANCGGDSGDW
jgi:hypothetical protein